MLSEECVESHRVKLLIKEDSIHILNQLFEHPSLGMCTLCKNNTLDSNICLHAVSQLMLCTQAACGCLFFG